MTLVNAKEILEKVRFKVQLPFFAPEAKKTILLGIQSGLTDIDMGETYSCIRF
jgi:hypothetical protein